MPTETTILPPQQATQPPKDIPPLNIMGGQNMSMLSQKVLYALIILAVFNLSANFVTVVRSLVLVADTAIFAVLAVVIFFAKALREGRAQITPSGIFGIQITKTPKPKPQPAATKVP